MDWKILLAYITGSVDEKLLLRNEHLVMENRLLRQQIHGRVRLTDAERKRLAAIGKQLGKKALAEIATIVTPDTILAWHRKLILIITNEAGALRRLLRRLGYDLAVAFNAIPSILAYTQDEWDQRKQSGSPFRQAVERDAVPVL